MEVELVKWLDPRTNFKEKLNFWFVVNSHYLYSLDIHVVSLTNWAAFRSLYLLSLLPVLTSLSYLTGPGPTWSSVFSWDIPQAFFSFLWVGYLSTGLLKLTVLTSKYSTYYNILKWPVDFSTSLCLLYHHFYTHTAHRRRSVDTCWILLFIRISC